MEIYSLKMALIFNNKNNNEISIDEKKNNLNNNEIISNNKKEPLYNKELRINNTLSGANKQLKNDFIDKFFTIKEYVSSKDYNSLANLLIKSIPEVVSDKNVLFTFKNNFEVILFDKNEEEISKLLFKIYNKKYKVVSITNDEWLKIKEKYINDIKNNIKYEYKEEKKYEKNSNKKTELESTVENIFGDDIIKVN